MQIKFHIIIFKIIFIDDENENIFNKVREKPVYLRYCDVKTII